MPNMLIVPLSVFRVTMPPKIFVGDVRCLAVPLNEYARALYGHFRDHFHRVACWRSAIALACCILASRFDPTVGS